MNGILPAQTVIYQQNFDSRAAGPYDDDALDEDWDEPNFNNGVTEGRVSVVSGGEAFGGSGSALAIEYPEGVHGTQLTGAQWRLSFGESFEEATISYRVRFSPGFDFVRGGKLPGLAGGSSPTGSTQATGFNGWTGRMMWRTDFNGTSGQPQQLTTGGITYTKHTTSGFSGDGVQEDRNPWTNPDGSATVMVADRWYLITQRIVMNTPGEFDGIQQIFLDGVMVINEQNLRYRLDDSFAIDQVYFSTFYGGNEDWRTSKDEVAFFDDFVVTVPDSEPTGSDEPPTNDDGMFLVPGQFSTIAAALDAANDGDTIQFSGVRSENVVVDKSVCIMGGQGAVLVPNNAGQATLIVDSDGVELKNFQIDGGRQNILVRSGNENVVIDNLFVQDADNIGIRVDSGCHGLIVRHSEVRDALNDGVRITASDNVVLDDTYSHRNASHGYRLISSDNAMFVETRTFMNARHGYDLEGDSMMLIDCTSLLNGRRGFEFDGGTNHFLFDNLAKDNLSHGFSFDGTTNSLVFDNRARFNLSTGIRVWANSNNNVFDDNNVTGNSSHGFLLGSSHGNSIVNSFIFINERSGILLNSSTTGNSATGNIVRSNLEFGIGDFGDNDDFAEGNTLQNNGQ